MEDFVFDIETTSLSFDSKFLCMAWAKTYKGPIHYTTDYGEAYSVLLEAVEDGKQIWGHNMLTFDLPFMIIKSAERCQQWHKQQKDTPDFPLLWALQHNPRNLHDTLVYSRRKFPKRKAHKMEAWAETLIGDYPINLKVEVKNFGTAEAELLKRRCTEDVKAQAALMHYMKVNYDITRSLPEMDFEMEWSKVVLELSSLGVPYDRTKARLSSSKLKAQKLVTMSPLRRKYPEVNFNASKQVDKALKEKYGRGLPVKRDTGNPSFGKDKRDQVCYMFPELTRMYHAREIDSQLKYIEPHDGKSYAGNYLAPSYLCGGYAVYPSLSVVGTRTGRMQYSDPPLQQMSKDIRHVFRAPRGWFLLGMDIVALEMAILGYILETVLGDSCIMNQVKEGLSAKKLTLEAFEPILGNVKLHGSQTLEDFAKTLNYSLLYGTGMATVGYKLNLPMDTSKQRKESIKRVKECVERRFPKWNVSVRLLGETWTV